MAEEVELEPAAGILPGAPVLGGSLGLMKPDPNCPRCLGVGQLLIPGRPGVSQKCPCVVRKEAIAYLTPAYANAKYDKSLDPTKIQGKSILFREYPKELFKQKAKSFLLNTGMRYKHVSYDGYDTVQAYISNSVEKGFDFIKQIDLFILCLYQDPPNKNYSQIFISLMEAREQRGLPTWVWTPYKIDTFAFTSLYQQTVGAYMDVHFDKVSPPLASKA